jgi:hypothetical protein
MSAPAADDRARRFEALAWQLHFASRNGAEGAETDSGGCQPPEQWSPLRAKAAFDELPEDLKADWIRYAERIAPFAGLVQALVDGERGSAAGDADFDIEPFV